MRDPKRIDGILSLLGDYWKNNPELRFWQVIYIVRSKLTDVDCFFNEDDVTEKALKMICKPPETQDVKLSVASWEEKWNLTIIDQDGWRVDGKSIHDKITEAEFFDRALNSTCKGDVAKAYTSFNSLS